VQANPTGGMVVGGSATFGVSGNTLAVTNSPGAIINWQSFNIAPNEVTRFIQQTATSAVLNRVIGGDPSSILGSLTSNGRVYLINPSGITFGLGSQIDVGGLVASSLNLSNADFLAGKNNFTAVSGAGNIVNQGNLKAANGGQIYLVAPSVENSGVITAPNGDVILAAGKSANLVDARNPDIQVEVMAPSNQVLNIGSIVGKNIGIYGGLIRHSGTINATTAEINSEGKVVFKAAGDITVDKGAVITANGTSGGAVTLDAQGTTLVSGTISANGSTGAGGTVQVFGNDVGIIDNAQITANGGNGNSSAGGTVLIGGDLHGANSAIHNATATYVGANASISANAGNTGDGGKVVVWSDEATRFYGSISAKGGTTAGNGGFVETSGHNYLDFGGTVNTSAPAGAMGTLLLDPSNIYIAANQGNATLAGMGGNDTSASVGTTTFQATTAVTDSLLTTAALTGSLASNNVLVTTTNAIGTAPLGNITVVDPVVWSSVHSLSLTAANTISINAAITDSAAGAVQLNSGGSISVAAPVSTVGGNFGSTNTGGSFTVTGAGSIATTNGRPECRKRDRPAASQPGWRRGKRLRAKRRRHHRHDQCHRQRSCDQRQQCRRQRRCVACRQHHHRRRRHGRHQYQFRHQRQRRLNHAKRGADQRRQRRLGVACHADFRDQRRRHLGQQYSDQFGSGDAGPGAGRGIGWRVCFEYRPDVARCVHRHRRTGPDIQRRHFAKRRGVGDRHFEFHCGRQCDYAG
jgi:filamentous hemagglutinin family protein